MMNESFNEELLSAYLDDELSPEERTRVEAWLAELTERSQMLSDLRALRSELQALPPFHLDDKFRRRVLGSIRTRIADYGEEAMGVTPLTPEPNAKKAGSSSTPESQPSVRLAGQASTMPSWEWISAGIAATLLIGLISITSYNHRELELGLRLEEQKKGVVSQRNSEHRFHRDMTEDALQRFGTAAPMAGANVAPAAPLVAPETAAAPVVAAKPNSDKPMPELRALAKQADAQAAPSLAPQLAAPAPAARPAEMSLAKDAAAGNMPPTARKLQQGVEANRLAAKESINKAAADKLANGRESNLGVAGSWDSALATAASAPGVVEIQIALNDATAPQAWLAANFSQHLNAAQDQEQLAEFKATAAAGGKEAKRDGIENQQLLRKRTEQAKSSPLARSIGPATFGMKQEAAEKPGIPSDAGEGGGQRADAPVEPATIELPVIEVPLEELRQVMVAMSKSPQSATLVSAKFLAADELEVNGSNEVDKLKMARRGTNFAAKKGTAENEKLLSEANKQDSSAPRLQYQTEKVMKSAEVPVLAATADEPVASNKQSLDSKDKSAPPGVSPGAGLALEEKQSVASGATKAKSAAKTEALQEPLTESQKVRVVFVFVPALQKK